jgi:hypothetical protein
MADSGPDALWVVRDGLWDSRSFCLSCERLSRSFRLRFGMLLRFRNSCDCPEEAILSWQW